MIPQDITQTLQARFSEACAVKPPDSWQVETSEFRLLVLLSSEQTWLRVLMPIVPMADAQPFFDQILAANFDQTQWVRYGTYENLLWGVFHHDLSSLGVDQFSQVVDQLLGMKQQGVDPFFTNTIERQVRKIIQAAKLQGQSLEATMQTIDRFYAEGMMGNMEDSSYGNRALGAWQRQLERLWPEVDVSEVSDG